MPTTTDGPVGPDTFTRDGHRVTIAEDGKIQVRKDDWLSKYSWAMYHDYTTLDVFVRPNPALTSPKEEIKGIKTIDDMNAIKTGEYLIHEPTYFHWMEKRGKPTYPGGRIPRRRPNYPKPGTPRPDKQLDPNRVVDFLRFLKQWLCPVNDWKFEGNGGVDLSVSFFTAHYCAIAAKRRIDPEPTWFHGVAAGVGIGLEDLGGSVSISPPEFPSLGFIGKFPTAGLSLSADEICGNYVVIDFSGGCFLGASFGLLLFGVRTGGEAIMRTIIQFLRGTGDSIWSLPRCFNGAVVMGGLNAPFPSLGVTLRLGLMHRKECIGL